ncbi:unnamed protein product, partial [Closterium sp. NIES-54]
LPSTHRMALRPSSVPQRVVLPSPPTSSLPHVPDPESDLVRAANPTVTCLPAMVVTDPSFESAATSALVPELVDFTSLCRLDYVASHVFYSSSPPSVGSDLALGCDVLEDRQFELECLAAAAPHLASTLLCPEGDPGALDIPTPRTYAESITSPLRPTTSAPRVARYTEDYTCSLGFAPSSADPSLFLCTDTSLPPFYVLVYVDDLVFAKADTEALALVKAELQERHTSTDLGELRSYLGLQITRDRARHTITLTQSHMVHQVLQRLDFMWSSPQPTPLSTGHSLSAPTSDESVESSGPYPELVGCLMYLMTCTQPDLAYPLSLLARYMAPVRHQKMHWDAVKRVLRYLCSTSGMGLVLGGRGSAVLTGHSDASWDDDQTTHRCEAEIYAGAMAAQELRWLTYLLTDLGERPPSPPSRGPTALLPVVPAARFLLPLLLRVQQFGGGGGCWEDAGVAVGGGCTSSAPLLCFVTKPETPPPLPLLSPPAAPTAAAVCARRLVRLCPAPRAPCPPAPAPPDRTPRSPLPSFPSPNCVCSNLGGGGGGVRGRWHQQHHPPLLSFTATPAAVGGEGGEGGVVGVTGGAAAAAARLPLCLPAARATVGGGGFGVAGVSTQLPPLLLSLSLLHVLLWGGG